jgi:hypothetical protein
MHKSLENSYLQRIWPLTSGETAAVPYIGHLGVIPPESPGRRGRLPARAYPATPDGRKGELLPLSVVSGGVQHLVEPGVSGGREEALAGRGDDLFEGGIGQPCHRCTHPAIPPAKPPAFPAPVRLPAHSGRVRHRAVGINLVAPLLEVGRAGQERVVPLHELAGQQGVQPGLELGVFRQVREVVGLTGVGLVVVEQPGAGQVADVGVAGGAHAAILFAPDTAYPFPEG